MRLDTADRSAVVLRPGPVLAILVVAQTMVSLDFSLVSMSIPSIEKALGTGPAASQWILTSDALAYGGFMIVGGRFADSYGPRRSLMIGLTLFLCGSAICIVAHGLDLLLVARVVQGFGAAFIFPATMALLANTFPAGRPRFRALTISTGVQALGVPAGTIAGGTLITQFGPSAAFALNLPICLLLLALLPRILPRGAQENRRRQPLPIASALLLTAGTALLIQSALGVVAHAPTTRMMTAYTLPLALLVLAAFIAVQRRASNPLISLSLLRVHHLGLLILVTALIIITGKGMVVLSNMSLQQGLHLSPFYSSLALLPMGISATLLIPLTPLLGRSLLDRPRATLVVSFALMGAIHATLSVTPGSIAVPMLLTLLFIQPYISVTATNIAIGETLKNVRSEDQGVAAGMLYTAVQIIGGLGMALMIASTDRSSRILDDYARFSPDFRLAVGIALLGLLLTLLTLRGEPRRRSILPDDPRWPAPLVPPQTSTSMITDDSEGRCTSRDPVTGHARARSRPSWAYDRDS